MTPTRRRNPAEGSGGARRSTRAADIDESNPDLDRLAASLTKDAAIAVSQALDWKAVAKRVRDRDEAIKSGAYIPRVVAQ